MRKSEDEKKVGSMKALKDFKIVHNKHCIEIKEGDDCSKVPAQFHENLKTEGVIKSIPKKKPNKGE